MKKIRIKQIVSILCFYFLFFPNVICATERSEDDLILYKTENYNISESCTFTGLNGLYELQYCQEMEENVPNSAANCISEKHTYMSYRAVTSKRSTQYKVLNSEHAWSDTETGLRMYKDRICVAIGTGYQSKAGDYIDLFLEDGTVIKCIVGDMKSDVHTDPSNRFQAVDGSVVECIVDYDYFSSTSQYPDFFHDLDVVKIINVNDFYEDSFH